MLDADPTSAPPVTPSAARSNDRLAQIGLVLSLVLVVAGVFAAAGKTVSHRHTSRDPLVAAGAPSSHDPASDPTPSAPVADVEVPAGDVIVQGDGVYLAVPSTWRTVSADAYSGAVSDEQLAQLYPDMDASFRSVIRSTLEKGALLIALNPQGPHRGSNVNVLRVAGEASLDELDREVQSSFHIDGVPLTIQETRKVDLPAGHALRMAYTMQINGRSVEAVQYYVQAHGSTYILSVTGDDVAGDAAAHTFRIGTSPQPA